MQRLSRLVIGAVVAGLLMTVTLVLAMSPNREAPQPEIDRQTKPAAPHKDIGHCRTITVPDAECGAAWEKSRQRFFGGKAAT